MKLVLAEVAWIGGIVAFWIAWAQVAYKRRERELDEIAESLGLKKKDDAS